MTHYYLRKHQHTARVSLRDEISESVNFGDGVVCHTPMSVRGVFRNCSPMRRTVTRQCCSIIFHVELILLRFVILTRSYTWQDAGRRHRKVPLPTSRERTSYVSPFFCLSSLLSTARWSFTLQNRVTNHSLTMLDLNIPCLRRLLHEAFFVKYCVPCVRHAQKRGES